MYTIQYIVYITSINTTNFGGELLASRHLLAAERHGAPGQGALLAAGRRGAPGCFLSGSVNFGRLVAARPRVCYEGHYGTRWLGSTAAVKYIPKI